MVLARLDYGQLLLGVVLLEPSALYADQPVDAFRYPETTGQDVRTAG